MYFGRGKNKIQDPYTVIDIYDFYIDEIGSNDLYYVDIHEYCDIVYSFYKSIMNAILYDNFSFKMPYGIGDLRVMKTKVDVNRLNVLSIDWKPTIENGKYIYHLNEHSRGFKYFFYWYKKKKIKNMYFYKLVITRANKRLLAKLIKTGKYDYFEI